MSRERLAARRLGAKPPVYEVHLFLWRDPIPLAHELRLDCDPYVFARRYLRFLTLKHPDEPWTRAEVHCHNKWGHLKLLATIRNRWKRAAYRSARIVGPDGSSIALTVGDLDQRVSLVHVRSELWTYARYYQDPLRAHKKRRKKEKTSR